MPGFEGEVEIMFSLASFSRPAEKLKGFLPIVALLRSFSVSSHFTFTFGALTSVLLKVFKQEKTCFCN